MSAPPRLPLRGERQPRAIKPLPLDATHHRHEPRRNPCETVDPHQLEHSWPEIVAPADPWAGDERLHERGSWEDLSTHGAVAQAEDLTQAQQEAWDDAFCHQYAAVLDGRAPWGATDRAGQALGLLAPRAHDRRPVRPAPYTLPDEALAHIVEDRLPDVRVLLERALGPFAELHLPPRVVTAGAAILGKAPLLRAGVRCYERLLKDKPKPPAAHRAVLRAVLNAPAMLWRLDGPRATPLLPLSNHYRPDDPWLAPTWRLGHPLPDLLEGVPAVVALGIHTPDRFWLAGVVPFPRIPSPQILLRRLTLEHQRLRRHDRRLTWEDLLRNRPEVLYRTACEWSWKHVGPEPTLACWRAASRC